MLDSRGFFYGGTGFGDVETVWGTEPGRLGVVRGGKGGPGDATGRGLGSCLGGLGMYLHPRTFLLARNGVADCDEGSRVLCLRSVLCT